MRKGQSILTIAFYFLMFLLVAWIVLKAVGILQSPLIVELSPFAFLGLLIYIERLGTRRYIDKSIRNAISPVERRLNRIENRLTRLEAKLEMILQFLKIKKK